jgi:hypothetical protein
MRRGTAVWSKFCVGLVVALAGGCDAGTDASDETFAVRMNRACAVRNDRVAAVAASVAGGRPAGQEADALIQLGEAFAVYERELERGPAPVSAGAAFEEYRRRVPELTNAALGATDVRAALADIDRIGADLARLERELGLNRCARTG